MKTKIYSLCIVLAFLAGIGRATAQNTTAFTYQGQLQTGGGPANGLYDFQFALSNAPSGGSQIGGTITAPGVSVTNGLFATNLDFGAVFNGGAALLSISVRSNGVGSYVALNPPQQILPAPYALYAPSAGLAANFNGAVALSQLPSAVVTNNAGVINGNGGGLTNLNAANLTGGVISTSLLPSFQGSYQTIGGGTGNTVNDTGSTIGGGEGNMVGGGNEETIGGGYDNIATQPWATVAGGYENKANGVCATAAGYQNQALNNGAVVSGGGNNLTIGVNSVIAGGAYNEITLTVKGSTIGGGYYNTNSGSYATVPGGYENLATGDYSFAAGYFAQATNNGAFVWADDEGTPFGSTTTNQFSVRASGGVSFVTSGAGLTVDGQQVLAGFQSGNNYNTIGGGSGNTILAAVSDATIGGGFNNTNNGNDATIGGGQGNEATANNSTVAGGYFNLASGNDSVVAGYENQALGISAVIGGGGNNTAGVNAENTDIAGGANNNVTQQGANIGGGYYNTNTGFYANIGGGYKNQASNYCATVPGGSNNVAGGAFSFAAGVNAQATNTGAFVWSDGSGTLTTSTNTNSVTMRASGGFRFMTSDSGTTTGEYLPAGGGGWVALSDRNSKENFQPVNASEVLAKVAALPMTSWNYKTEDASIRHLGPMAQDFKASFQVGETDTGICTVDEEGVALAAIQGLNEKLNERDAEIERLRAKADKVDSLEKQLNELQTMVKQLAAQK